jgi:peptidoglycan/xylan/chitin deacetylase (PgdA/CDA1 family)
LAAALPEPVAERARLLLARRLEQRVRRSQAVRGAAIVFHGVAPRAGDPATEIEPPVARARLDAAIGYLADRYTLVRAAELPAAARGRTHGSPVPVAVTFDDDLASHRDYALPALKRRNAVATAFLCEPTAPFWWQLLQVAVDRRAIAGDGLPAIPAAQVEDALNRRPGAIQRLAKAIEDLTPSQRDKVEGALAKAVPRGPEMLGPDGVAALTAAGWEVGFHTRDHYLLTTLDDDALTRALEPVTVKPSDRLPRTLAYPHGKATMREADAARRAGYLAAFTGYPHVFTERTHDHLIGRLQPDTTTLGRFALQLARALSAA